MSNFDGQFGEITFIKNFIDDNRIGNIIPKTCVEFGAYDGISNSNTIYFWKKKRFKSLLIEPNLDLFNKLVKNTQNYQNCVLANEYISSKNNLSKVIKRHNFPRKIGVLSIDIDSNDLEIFRDLNHSSTYIVIIEFNNQLPVWCDYEDPKGHIVFRHSALATLKTAEKLGYQMLTCKGPNLILANKKNLPIKKIKKIVLEDCFDYYAQKKACRDIKIIGCKFTTNAKVFRVKPNLYLNFKKYFYQLILKVNYFLRQKEIPSSKIPDLVKIKLKESGLYI